MKKNICVGAAVIALALGGVAAAQSSNSPGQAGSPTGQSSGSSPGQSTSSTTRQNSAEKDNVTVSGCIQSASQGIGGAAAAGAAGGANPSSRSSSDNDKFVLTNAKMGSSAAGATSSTRSETSPGASSTASGSTFMLEGKSSEVKQHLNHQVEITGRLESKGSSTSSSARAGDTTTSTSTASGGQELHVESVRMISATCSK